MELWKFNENGFMKPANISVRHKKQVSGFLKKAREQSKFDECYYCKVKAEGFCNSHSVPAFSLRNIACEGKLYFSNNFIEKEFDTEKGVNNAGTFTFICRNCDSAIFQDYENPDNYTTKPTPKMLAQIAMKNYLNYIYKRNLELAIFANAKAEYKGSLNFHGFKYMEQEIKIKQLDLAHYEKRYDKAKRLSKKDNHSDYYCFYCELLDYRVPIAFQDGVMLISDLENSMINNIYDLSNESSVSEVHICIFPLESSSVVMMFIDSVDKRYRAFYKQFAKLSPSDKLGVVNYIAFLYSENVFISKCVDESVLNNKSLISISRQTSTVISETPTVSDEEIVGVVGEFDLSKWRTIPNLLDRAYAIPI